MENATSELVQKLKTAEDSRDDEVKKREDVEKELDELRLRYQSVVDEKEILKIEVQKGIEDI